jgi:hypothetical protein
MSGKHRRICFLPLSTRLTAAVFAWAEDGEAAVFRIRIDADFLQQVLVLAEHFGDTADCEDVA